MYWEDLLHAHQRDKSSMDKMGSAPFAGWQSAAWQSAAWQSAVSDTVSRPLRRGLNPSIVGPTQSQQEGG